MAHYIEVTIDPDGNPDSPYAWDRWDMSAIECSTPGGCGGWLECTLDHPGMDPYDEDSPAFDAEEWEIHGVLHTWQGWTWSVPFDGCPVAEWADVNDLWDGVDGPGRYEVDADWNDDTECYLTVVGKVDADNEGGRVMMSTLRGQVETEATSWAEWHRSHGQAVSRRTEQAMTEADACAAAYALIGQAHRERGEDESPEDFMREYARVSPYGHELARRVLQRLAWHYSPLFPASDPSRITWVWMASAPSRRRERRAWAVWDRKRRARRKR